MGKFVFGIWIFKKLALMLTLLLSKSMWDNTFYCSTDTFNNDNIIQYTSSIVNPGFSRIHLHLELVFISLP